MQFGYVAYGIGLVTDRPVAGLDATSSQPRHNFTLHVGAMLARRLHDFQLLAVRHTSPRTVDGRPLVIVTATAESRQFHFQYSDGIEFFIDDEESAVFLALPPSAIFDDAVPYLLGPIFGVLLRLRGTPSLHSSVVSIADRAVAFVGPGGAGKSTMGAAFALAGYRTVSDDIAALWPGENGFVVEPGYPRFCLWPDSAEALVDVEPLARLVPVGGISESWDKRFLDVAARSSFERSARPLGVVYLLAERRPWLGRLEAEALSPREALIELSANSYVNYVLDAPMRAHEFDVLGRLVAHVPVYRVSAPVAHTDLPAFCEAVAAHILSQRHQARRGAVKAATD